MKFIYDVLELLFLRKCVKCNNLLENDEELYCNNCLSEIEFPEKSTLCSVCLGKMLDKRCLNCYNKMFAFNKLYSYFKYDDVLKNLIRKLKYEDSPKIGEGLGIIVGKKLKVDINLENAYFIPIPLHIRKKFSRGYNQAYFIAKGLVKETNGRLLDGVIKRVKYTETQTKLNRTMRVENLAEAFSINEKKIGKMDKNAMIFIVDDIFTTGATINSCAKKFKEAGFKNIYALTVARAGD